MKDIIISTSKDDFKDKTEALLLDQDPQLRATGRLFATGAYDAINDWLSAEIDRPDSSPADTASALATLFISVLSKVIAHGRTAERRERFARQLMHTVTDKLIEGANVYHDLIMKDAHDALRAEFADTPLAPLVERFLKQHK